MVERRNGVGLARRVARDVVECVKEVEQREVGTGGGKGRWGGGAEE